MKSISRSKQSGISMIDRLLHTGWAIALLGLGLGVTCAISTVIVTYLVLDTAPDPMPIPAQDGDQAWDLMVIIEESYLNRQLVEGAQNAPGALTIQDGRLDLRPGSMADAQIELQVGPLTPLVTGTVGFQVNEAGNSIELLLLDARLGYLCLNRIIPDHALDPVNKEIAELVANELGAHRLRVHHVDTDATTLRLYFGR